MSAGHRRTVRSIILTGMTVFAAAAATHVPRGFERAPTAGALPDWLTLHFTRLVAGGDWWITDNAQYRTDDEPWDAYAMEWAWGLGRQSVTGRLFGIRDGKDVGTFWQFRVYWHPGRKETVIIQYGGDGTVGEGTVRQTGNGVQTEAIQIFTAPDGTAMRVRHLETTTDSTHDTRSFDDVKGQWQARRDYVWHRRPKPAPPK